MLKTAITIGLLCSLSLADSGTNEEKTYIFKAKGEFAEELKALMEKHEKDGKVQIEEVKESEKKNSRYNTNAPSLLDSFLNSEDLSGDIAYGKDIYDKKCFNCHGKKADKSTFPTARNLNTLTKEELYDSLYNYKTDATYGKASKFVMHEQAVGMTTPEMISVSAYIYSLTHSKKEATESLNKEEEKKKEGVQGTYLR